MDLTKEDLLYLAEALETRFTYLRKMVDPQMGLKDEVVTQARTEIQQLSELHQRICGELKK